MRERAQIRRNAAEPGLLTYACGAFFTDKSAGIFSGGEDRPVRGCLARREIRDLSGGLDEDSDFFVECRLNARTV